MKIALINDQPTDTGMGVYVHNLLPELQKFCEISHLFLNYKNRTLEILQSSRRLQNDNINKTILNESYKIPLIDNKTWFWERIINKIPKNDIYHFTSQNMSFLLQKFRDRFSPSIVTCYDIIPYIMPNNLWDYYSKKYAYSGLKFANKIVAISECTKQDLMKHLSIPAEKIVVTYLGVTNDFCLRNKNETRKKLGLPLNKKIILNVSARYKRKNVRTVINIFHQIQKEIPDTILIKIGSERKENIELIKKLGVNDKTIFIPNLLPKQLPLYYNAADVFLFPSLYEGFGLPVLEAMASGCPVVCSNTSSLPEVVGDGGLMFDLQDVQGFKDAVFQVLTEKQFEQQVIDKGLKQSIKFSWDKTAEQTYKTYQTV